MLECGCVVGVVAAFNWLQIRAKLFFIDRVYM